MEAIFAHTYLLLFGQLAAGGLFAMAVPPFARMARGFYSSTGAVYLLLAVLMTAGEATLYARSGQRGPVPGWLLAAWTVFTLTFAAYYVTLFLENPLLTAKTFPVALLAALAAVVASACSFVPAEASRTSGAVLALPLVTGAALSGATLSGMLLGHWFLVDRGLDPTILERMRRYCRRCLAAEVVSVLVATLVLVSWPDSPWQTGVAAIVQGSLWPLLAGRVACWFAAAALFALIGRTLVIPQTMAATGLFYIATLTVAVGEICGHWLLFRTGLPL